MTNTADVAKGAAVVGLLLFGGSVSPPDAPAQEAERQEQRYDVERGDTLWEIARRLLDDPFQWQRIWEANRGRLSSPDLILPGQRLVIPEAGAAGAREEAGDRDEAERGTLDPVPEARASIFDRGRPEARLQATGQFTAEERPSLRPVSRGDALGAPFLAAGEELEPRGRVLGPVSDGRRASTAWHGRVDDPVRVRLRGIEAAPGDTLVAVRIGDPVRDLGRVVHPAGLLAVESVSGDTAVARVADVFGLVQPGDPVLHVPLPEIPSGTEYRASERTLTASVVDQADGSALMRPGELVFLDRGSADGVRAGDVFRLSPGGGERTAAGDRGARSVVVRVGPRTSTARVVDVGDGTVTTGETARLVQRLVGPGR